MFIYNIVISIMFLVSLTLYVVMTLDIKRYRGAGEDTEREKIKAHGTSGR